MGADSGDFKAHEVAPVWSSPDVPESPKDTTATDGPASRMVRLAEEEKMTTKKKVRLADEESMATTKKTGISSDAPAESMFSSSSAKRRFMTQLPGMVADKLGPTSPTGPTHVFEFSDAEVIKQRVRQSLLKKKPYN